MNEEAKAKLEIAGDDPVSIKKPPMFDLNQFKSSVPEGEVGVVPSALPIMKISEANDFVRLHPDEVNYWTAEWCFVNVPVKGGKKREVVHLINEAIAKRHLAPGKVERYRLALASKPGNVFFLCKVPTRNLDNDWNRTAVDGCIRAKTFWVQATSMSNEDQPKEMYRITDARNQGAFLDPNWPAQSLDELVHITFGGTGDDPNTSRMIMHDTHPGLLRLVGDKQSLL